MKSESVIFKIISYTFLFLLITFLIHTFMIGGDALSGKVENGLYYVWDSIHKRNQNGETLYLEVSKGAYMFNLTVTYLFFFMIPIFLLFKIRDFLNNKNKGGLK